MEKTCSRHHMALDCSLQATVSMIGLPRSEASHVGWHAKKQGRDRKAKLAFVLLTCAQSRSQLLGWESCMDGAPHEVMWNTLSPSEQRLVPQSLAAHPRMHDTRISPAAAKQKPEASDDRRAQAKMWLVQYEPYLASITCKLSSSS
jgi:hypothetical protein